MEYTGTEGKTSVSVSSVINEGLDDATTFTLSTEDGSVSHNVVVNREGRREIYNEDFILKDGCSFNVIKEGYR